MSKDTHSSIAEPLVQVAFRCTPAQKRVIKRAVEQYNENPNLESITQNDWLVEAVRARIDQQAVLLSLREERASEPLTIESKSSFFRRILRAVFG